MVYSKNIIIAVGIIACGLDYTRSALESLAFDGDNRKLIACIETVLASLSNRDSIKMDEKYIKTICFTLCMLSKCYAVESENEANKGYSDIQLLKRPGIDVEYYALVKLKEAKEQLVKYCNSPKLKGMDNLKKWAVVFVGDQCVINEELK